MVTRTGSRSSIFRMMWVLLLAGSAGRTVAAEDAAKRVATEPAVMMRPFKVIAEWMDIRPLLRNGVIESVAIARVSSGCPADVAGVRPGMRATEIQGIQVVGLTEAVFIERLHALPPATALTLTFAAITRKAPLVYVVPIDSDAGNLLERIKLLKKSVESEPVSADEVRDRLATAAAVFAKELKQAESSLMAGGATINSLVPRIEPGVPFAVREQATEEFARIPVEHLAILCEAALKKKSDKGATIALKYALIDAISERRDYGPQQKVVVVRYLPLLPDLIRTMENMNWFEGAEAAVAAGWAQRQAERGYPFYSENQRLYYAIVAAPHGLLEGLVEVARIVDDPDKAGWMLGGDWRLADYLVKQASAALEKAVPLDNATPKARAKFVLKNKARLAFDTGRGVYVLGK